MADTVATLRTRAVCLQLCRLDKCAVKPRLSRDILLSAHVGRKPFQVSTFGGGKRCFRCSLQRVYAVLRDKYGPQTMWLVTRKDSGNRSQCVVRSLWNSLVFLCLLVRRSQETSLFRKLTFPCRRGRRGGSVPDVIGPQT